MEIFDRDAMIRCNVTAFNTFELDHKIGRRKSCANFYVNRPCYRASSNVAKHVVVEIDVDSAIHVQV